MSRHKHIATWVAVLFFLALALRSAAAEMNRSTSLYTRSNGTVAGRLDDKSTLFKDGTYGEEFEYPGAGGERLVITMSSPRLDSFLLLRDSAGKLVELDNNSGAGYDARLDLELPRDDTYRIVVTTPSPKQKGRRNGRSQGDYELRVLSDHPGYARSGSKEVLNPTNDLLVPHQNPAFGQLETGDLDMKDRTVADTYVYSGKKDERLVITMESGVLDSLILLLDPNRDLLAKDDDSGRGFDARLEFTLPAEGRFVIVATTPTPGGASRRNDRIHGPYKLTVLSDARAYAGLGSAASGKLKERNWASKAPAAPKSDANRYVHPALHFGLQAPAGWTPSTSPLGVTLSRGHETLFVGFVAEESPSAADYARKLEAEGKDAGLRSLETRVVTVDGAESLSTLYELRGAKGMLRRSRVFLVPRAGGFFALAGEFSLERLEAGDKALHAVVRSFRFQERAK